MVMTMSEREVNPVAFSLIDASISRLDFALTREG